MKNSTIAKLRAGFGITLFVIIANALISYRSTSQLLENEQQVRRIQQVKNELESALSTLKDAETGQHGYLITENLRYLELYNAARDRLNVHLQNLRQLAANNPSQRQQIALLERKIAVKLNQLEQTIILRRTKGFEAARQIVLSDKGKQVMDDIRQLFTQMEDWQKALSLAQSQESQASYQQVFVTFSLSAILDVALLILLYHFLKSYITNRDRAEAKLTNLADELQELYDRAPCGYHSLDADGKFVRINDTELQMLGYTREEIVGKKFSDLLTAESIVVFQQNFPLFQQRGWVQDLEFHLKRKDGTVLPVSLSATVIYDETGKYSLSRSVVVEIGDRKLAEAALHQQHQQSQLFAEITLRIRQSLHLEEILQTSVREVQKLLQADRVLICQIMGDGTGTVVQEAVLPGYPVMLGQQISEPCLTQDYQEKYRQGRTSAIVNLEPSDIQPYQRELLQQFDVKAHLVVPILQREEIWGLLIAHQCRAARQWTEIEIELMRLLADQIGIALSQAQLLEREIHQKQELARSNAELEQFAYVASHDLQEPLRMVISYLQLLQRRYQNQLDSAANEFINYAVDGGARMQVLINDLLSYSRVGTRAQPFELVDCNTILNRTLANLKIAIAESDAVITNDELPTVTADPTQLAQLFQNLIGNAIKFCRDESPQIHVSAARLDRYWRFSIRDNGIGIEPQYRDRIFVIFQRLHARGKYPGTGIGLAICKKIVERHGGQIWVESEVGQGAIFYFTIPDLGK